MKPNFKLYSCNVFLNIDYGSANTADHPLLARRFAASVCVVRCCWRSYGFDILLFFYDFQEVWSILRPRVVHLGVFWVGVLSSRRLSFSQGRPEGPQVTKSATVQHFSRVSGFRLERGVAASRGKKYENM